MASTVPRARVANWPHGQVQKGISKPTHQSNIEALYLRERTFSCIALRRRQAETCTSCDSRYRNLTSGTPHVRKDQVVRDERKPFTATGCSGNSNSWALQRLNIARIYCFLRMSTIVD